MLLWLINDKTEYIFTEKLKLTCISILHKY